MGIPIKSILESYLQRGLGVAALALSIVLAGGTPALAEGSALPPGEVFGRTPKGQAVTLYTLTNGRQATVKIMDYGATVTSIRVPDRAGKLGEVVLGFDKFAPYLKQTAFLGAVAGRYANRIAGAEFSLGKETFHLAKNNGPNCLHGGTVGFDKRLWKAEAVEDSPASIRFSRLSPDGEEGFPGNLFVSVTYTLTEENELRFTFEATTDKLTVLNLVNHSYFNLAGQGTVLDHTLKINADALTPVNATLIPTGEIQPVAGTPWDFRQPTPIGAHLKETGGIPVGYDHNFVLKKGWFSPTAVAAEVSEPTTGRTLKVTTDQPGVQFYTGNFLDGSLVGHERRRYAQYTGFCLETQHFPDSPNQPKFPSTTLYPGATFRSTTTFAFGIDPAARP